MLIIDRFEGDIAVIEDGGETFDIPRSLLQENAGEGDVVTEKDGVYTVDSAASVKRRQEILELQNSLWE